MTAWFGMCRKINQKIENEPRYEIKVLLSLLGPQKSVVNYRNIGMLQTINFAKNGLKVCMCKKQQRQQKKYS